MPSAGMARRVAGWLPVCCGGLVEDYLRDHPGEFSPHVIARALGGKSAGAVNNALERLTAAGTVVKSSEKPKKFTLARSELDTIREAATG